MTNVSHTVLYRDFIYIRVTNGPLMDRHAVTRGCNFTDLLLHFIYAFKNNQHQMNYLYQYFHVLSAVNVLSSCGLGNTLFKWSKIKNRRAVNI